MQQALWCVQMCHHSSFDVHVPQEQLWPMHGCRAGAAQHAHYRCNLTQECSSWLCVQSCTVAPVHIRSVNATENLTCIG